MWQYYVLWPESCWTPALRHALTGLGLVTPAAMWTLLEAQYGLAAISGPDIARWYASTQVPFDRTALLSVNIYRDTAAYSRVTELLGAHHALSQMQMLLQLSEKTAAYHVTSHFRDPAKC